MFWIGLGCGVLVMAGISVLVVFLLIDKWHVGTLNLDESIPEEPYYFMEVSAGSQDKLKSNRLVLLRVSKRNYIRDT